jgi:hypothetical protein
VAKTINANTLLAHCSLRGEKPLISINIIPGNIANTALDNAAPIKATLSASNLTDQDALSTRL